MRNKLKFFGILMVSILFVLSCNEDKYVESVTLNETSLELGVGLSFQLTANVLPEGAIDKTVTWESSNNEVATVDKNGKVTAVKVGDATITVTTTDGNKTATCKVSVIFVDMVFVPGGTFGMGNPDEFEYYDHERPFHQVTVSDFYIGKYEVTNAQYARFLNAKGYHADDDDNLWINLDYDICQIELVGDEYKVEEGKEDYPVIYVTWYGANAYAEWVGGRLPTEAEWEYAAGGQANEYSGSDNIDAVAWYIDNSINPNNSFDAAGRGTHIVGTKQPNSLGIYDMSGNVAEWCSDWYGDYTADAQVNPTGPVTGETRVVRGGDWQIFKDHCRVIARNAGSPGAVEVEGFGFRVVFLMN